MEGGSHRYNHRGLICMPRGPVRSYCITLHRSLALRPDQRSGASLDEDEEPHEGEDPDGETSPPGDPRTHRRPAMTLMTTWGHRTHD